MVENLSGEGAEAREFGQCWLRKLFPKRDVQRVANSEIFYIVRTTVSIGSILVIQ